MKQTVPEKNKLKSDLTLDKHTKMDGWMETKWAGIKTRPLAH